MIKLVIANTHAEARSYCYEHQLDQRTLTVTPACPHQLRGISLTDDEVVNIARANEMNDFEWSRYTQLMMDLGRALLRGDRR